MDKNDANVMFGSANVEKVKSFKIDGGEVDFGDHLHIGGSPQGNAIVVWSIDGRAAVRGVLFSDNFRDPQTATVEIRFRRANGQFTNWTRSSVSSQGGPMNSFYAKLVEKVSPTGRFDEVQIRLKHTLPDTGLGPVTTILATKTFKR
jgi:hypothetical protein